MSKNIWELNLDIKFRYSASMPIFRRKDSAVLKINLYDAKEKKDISNFDKATLSIKYPSGVVVDVDAVRQGSGIDTYVYYAFPEDVSMEIGIYDLILTVERQGGFISTPKFHITVFDNISQAEYEFVKMIQDMQLQIDYLETLIGSIVPQTSIAQANGLVPLDSQGKIPMAHMPLFLEEHINTNVYLKLVHGFMIDKDRKPVYETEDGSLEYIGHPDNSGLNNRLNLTTMVKDSIVTLYYSGRGNATLQKWIVGNKNMNDAKTSGTTFTGLNFKVNQTGIHTIYYVDNFKNEYLYKFSVDISQLKEPTVEVIVDGGKVNIDSDTPLDLIKIGVGRQTTEWFHSNGTIITPSYRITEVGDYTVYYKDKLGREYIKYITVTEDMLENNDTDPPTITFVETPPGYVKDKKVVEITVSDLSPIADKRYKVLPWSSPERPTQSKFELDPNYGTKMSSNTVKVTLTESSVIYVYAQDQQGNKAFKTYYMTNIDNQPPTMEAYDYWDSVKQKYIIKFIFMDSASLIKEITLPDGSKYPQASPMYSIEDSIEVASFGDKTFKATDQVGNTKTYSYKMKGKVKKVFAQESTMYIIREDGYLYSAGGNESFLLGRGEDSSGVSWSDKFSKVITDVKFRDKIDTSGSAAVFIDTNGSFWQLGEINNISYNRANNISRTEPYLVKLSDVTGMTGYSPNLDNGTGVLAYLKNGQWMGTGGGLGQFGDGTETIYKNWSLIGKNMPVSFGKYIAIMDNGYFFGSDGKIYASGRNDTGLQGGFTPTQSYSVYSTPVACDLINPHGEVFDITAQSHHSFRWWVLRNKILLTGNQATKDVKVINNMPSNFLKTSRGARDALMFIYKNDIYVNGWNSEGQLGLGNKDSTNETEVVRVPFNQPIADACLSAYMGIVLTESGMLMMSGENINSTSYVDATTYLEKYETIQ